MARLVCTLSLAKRWWFRPAFWTVGAAVALGLCSLEAGARWLVRSAMDLRVERG